MNILYQRVKRGDLGVEQAKLSFYRVFALGMLLDEGLDDSLAIRAIELAHRFHLPAAYDAQYLALAEREGCDFWTADQRLRNTVQGAVGVGAVAGHISADQSEHAIMTA